MSDRVRRTPKGASRVLSESHADIRGIKPLLHDIRYATRVLEQRLRETSKMRRKLGHTEGPP